MKTPSGEDRERRVCDTCGFIDYVNPRIVAGVVAHRDGKILLCRRAIEPRKGFWTLPAGFMELGESVDEGASREAREEAGITGKMRKKSIGSYSYDKQKASGAIPVRVKVFLLEVEIELDDWPESRQRERIWCSVDIAAASVAEPELAALIRQHSKRHGI